MKTEDSRGVRKKAISIVLDDGGPTIYFVCTESEFPINKYVLIEIDESFVLSSADVNGKSFETHLNYLDLRGLQLLNHICNSVLQWVNAYLFSIPDPDIPVSFPL